MFEEVVEGAALDFGFFFGVGVFFSVADGPADVGRVSFAPPAVEGAEVEGAVGGGFHAAGAGGFEGFAGGVEPDVGALGHVSGDVDVVVFEEDDAVAEGFFADEVDELFHEFFAGGVHGVGLAGEDDLDGMFGVGEEGLEALGVVEDEGGALVGGETAGEADGEDFGIEGLLDFGEDVGGSAAAEALLAEAFSGEPDEAFAAVFMGAPEFGVGHGGDFFPDAEVHGLFDKAGAQVVVEEFGEVVADPGAGMDAVGDAFDGDFAGGDVGP